MRRARATREKVFFLSFGRSGACASRFRASLSQATRSPDSVATPPRSASSKESVHRGENQAVFDDDERRKLATRLPIESSLPRLLPFLQLFHSRCPQQSRTRQPLVWPSSFLSALCARGERKKGESTEREERKRTSRRVSMAAAAAERASSLSFPFSLLGSPLFSISFSTYVGLDPAPLVSDSCDLGGDAGHGCLRMKGDKNEQEDFQRRRM